MGTLGEQTLRLSQSEVVVTDSKFQVRLFGVDEIVVLKQCLPVKALAPGGSAFVKIHGSDRRSGIGAETIVQKTEIILRDICGIHVIDIIPCDDGTWLCPYQGNVTEGDHSQAVGKQWESGLPYDKGHADHQDRQHS